MKKIVLAMILIFITINVYCETLDFSMRTGYYSGIESNWCKVYGGIDDFKPDTESREAGPGTYEVINYVLQVMKDVEDELFDYEKVANDIENLMEQKKIEVKTNTDEDITHVALATYDENENITLYVSRFYLEDEQCITLIISSLVREFKVIHDCFYNSRLEHISANKLEEYLYILDSYYFQSRFINNAFISKNYKVSRFEWFLSVDYQENYLASL